MTNFDKLGELNNFDHIIFEYHAPMVVSGDIGRSLANDVLALKVMSGHERGVYVVIVAAGQLHPIVIVRNDVLVPIPSTVFRVAAGD